MNPEIRRRKNGFEAMILLLLMAAIRPPQANGQSSTDIVAVPNRPTFSTTAETVQEGVFEIEYGFEAANGHQNINGLLKFGLLKKLEIRFANNPVTRDDGNAGMGDSGAGFKFRILEQKGASPTISVLYTLAIPTSAPDQGGLGHSAGILFSKDFGRHHLDFNESVQWLPKSAGGFDHNYFTAISYSHPISEKLGFSEELAGFSRTNSSPATLTILQAVTYAISPRLVLDAGFYISGMGDLPRATAFAGITYALGDLYRHLRSAKH
jgi:hypothetical protein